MFALRFIMATWQHVTSVLYSSLYESMLQAMACWGVAYYKLIHFTSLLGIALTRLLRHAICDDPKTPFSPEIALNPLRVECLWATKINVCVCEYMFARCHYNRMWCVFYFILSRHAIPMDTNCKLRCVEYTNLITLMDFCIWVQFIFEILYHKTVDSPHWTTIYTPNSFRLYA